MKLFAIIILSLFLLIPDPSDADDQSATITFLDGHVKEINQFRFVYHWIWSSHNKYYNPPHQKKISDDFHYAVDERGSLIGKSVKIDNINSIRINWKPGPFGKGSYEPILLTLLLKDGKQIELPASDIKATTSFLLGKENNDSALLEVIHIDGKHQTSENTIFNLPIVDCGRIRAYFEPDKVITDIKFTSH
jgi:prepilin-type processing-associated H-X9-DG protein